MRQRALLWPFYSPYTSKTQASGSLFCHGCGSVLTDKYQSAQTTSNCQHVQISLNLSRVRKSPLRQLLHERTTASPGRQIIFFHINSLLLKPAKMGALEVRSQSNWITHSHIFRRTLRRSWRRWLMQSDCLHRKWMSLLKSLWKTWGCVGVELPVISWLLTTFF